jgi:hypothetical protein
MKTRLLVASECAGRHEELITDTQPPHMQTGEEVSAVTHRARYSKKGTYSSLSKIALAINFEIKPQMPCA